MKTYLVILFAACTFASVAQTRTINYTVYFKNDKIGTLHAEEKIAGNNVQIDLKTNTDAKILVMSIHVESEVKVLHSDAVMKKGIAYRHSNRGTEDIVGFTERVDNKKYHININQKEDKLEGADITFCVANLYFKEPVSLTKIYSNMYGCMVSVIPVGNHKYKMTMPDGKDNYYTYINGELETVEVGLTVGTVVSKRIH